MKFAFQKGFTVPELMMALAVAAILLALAVPDFTTLTMNKRMTTQTNDFIATLALARSEALKRVSRVTVCKSADGVNCTTSGGWEQGWIVFNDRDNDGQRDQSADPDVDEPVLRFQSALESDNTLRGSGDVADYISYVSSGATRLTNGNFQAGVLALCDNRGAGEHAKGINISITGRARVEGNPPSCSPGDGGDGVGVGVGIGG